MEAVVSGESGIVVDGARVEEVAAGLRRLLQAPEGRSP